MPARYFDLHLHPVLKTMFRHRGNQLSPWQVISVNDGIFENALDSQASLGQIARRWGMNLICMPIFAPEMALVDQWKLILGSLFFKKQIDTSRVKAMGKGVIDYRSVRQDEQKQILRAPQSADGPDLAGKKVKLIAKWSDYNKEDLDTIHILFCVEGAHNFYGPGNSELDTGDMLDNFRTLIGAGTKILYLTPAHLAPNVLINHAYGIKIFNKAKFVPVEDGIPVKPYPPVHAPTKTNCFDFFNLAHEQGVIIDVKHMSLKSRKQFYAHHDGNYFSDRPIFASHVGFTGMAYADIPGYKIDVSLLQSPGYKGYRIRYRRPEGHLAGTFFNPCSINMYDDDIQKVIGSGGLIGLSMDVRIMGADVKKNDTKPVDSEYISPGELGEFSLKVADVVKSIQVTSTDAADSLLLIMDEEDLKDHDEEVESTLELAGNRFHTLHLRSFINHILHLCKLHEAAPMPSHPLTQVCIGSDFDGLIQSLHCCKSVAMLQDFASDLRAALPGCAKEAGITLGMDIEDILDGLFFKNAHAFLERHLLKVETGSYRKPMVK